MLCPGLVKLGLKCRNAANQPVRWVKICAKVCAGWESLSRSCKLVLLYLPRFLYVVVTLDVLVCTTGGEKCRIGGNEYNNRSICCNLNYMRREAFAAGGVQVEKFGNCRSEMQVI